MSLKPVRASYSDEVLGPLITKIIQNPKPSLDEKIWLRVYHLSLPFFHLADSVASLANYCFDSLRGKEWICKNVPTSFYLTLAKQHAKAIFTSFIDGFAPCYGPANGLYGFEYLPVLPKEGITYTLMPLSRFGDNLKCYFAARYIAHKKNTPLILKKFEHIEGLSIIQDNQLMLPPHIGFMNVFTQIENPDQYQSNNGIQKIRFLYGFDSNDEDFKKLVEADLKTSTNPQNLVLPKDTSKYNVALHYREGGAFDDEGVRKTMPEKLPPQEFYEKSVQHLLSTEQQPIHIQMFTDSETPHKQLEIIEQVITKSDRTDVTLSYQATAKGVDTVLSDMLSMAEYNCLIRPDSGLSGTAALIATLSDKPLRELYLEGASFNKTSATPTKMLHFIDITRTHENSKLTSTKKTIIDTIS